MFSDWIPWLMTLSFPCDIDLPGLHCFLLSTRAQSAAGFTAWLTVVLGKPGSATALGVEHGVVSV